MHAAPPSHPYPPVLRRRLQGFSLAEVAMAIAIISVVFVSLFALIPGGLGELRKAMDANNDSRIVQSFVSLALASEYTDLPTLDKPIYYFDDEGSFLDTSTDPKPNTVPSRLYAAKAFVEPAKLVQSPDLTYAWSSRVVLVWGNMYNMDTSKLEGLTFDQLPALLKTAAGKRYAVRSITIAKTDGK